MTDPVDFLQALVRAQKDGEAAVQRLVADAARARQSGRKRKQRLVRM